MSQILLLSFGLGALVEFVKEDPEKTRLVFIPTAGKTYKDPWWVDRDRNTLKQLGFKFSEFDIADKTAAELSKALTNIDVVFVAGGNTFYLLDMMQRCGFEQRIKTLLDQSVQYVGGSAGAIVAGPDIEPIRSLDDPQDAPNLKTTKGLGLVDFVVIPHVNMNMREDKIDKVKKEFSSSFNLIPLTDEQAIVVDKFKNFKIVESKLD
ncbi:MAG TPA: Type 1 glutamine amidotransferase-like domain-containing protein [Candidatus Saccharimonadales bacterium]